MKINNSFSLLFLTDPIINRSSLYDFFFSNQVKKEKKNEYETVFCWRLLTACQCVEENKLKTHVTFEESSNYKSSLGK